MYLYLYPSILYIHIYIYIYLYLYLNWRIWLSQNSHKRLQPSQIQQLRSGSLRPRQQRTEAGPIYIYIYICIYIYIYIYYTYIYIYLFMRTLTGASGWPRMPISVCNPPKSRSSAAAVLDPASSVQRQAAPASAAARSGGLEEYPPSRSGSTPSIAPASRARWPASGRSAAIQPMAAAAEMAASVAEPRARTCTSNLRSTHI